MVVFFRHPLMRVRMAVELTGCDAREYGDLQRLADCRLADFALGHRQIFRTFARARRSAMSSSLADAKSLEVCPGLGGPWHGGPGASA